MARRFAVWGLAGGLLACAWGASGCARPVQVARPAEGVEYVVLRVPGMVPQARLERCTDAGCEAIHDPEQRATEEAP